MPINLNDITMQVRINVGDADVNPDDRVYADSVYQQEIYNAIYELNASWTLATIPDGDKILVLYLATANMCLKFASRAADSQDQIIEIETTDPTSLNVPTSKSFSIADISLSESHEGASSKASIKSGNVRSWLDLYQKYMDKLKAKLETTHLFLALPELQSGQFTVKNPRTRAEMPYNHAAKPIPATLSV